MKTKSFSKLLVTCLAIAFILIGLTAAQAETATIPIKTGADDGVVTKDDGGGFSYVGDNGTTLYAGYFMDWDADWFAFDRSYLQFDTSALPDNAIINSATLNLYGVDNYWGFSNTQVRQATTSYPLTDAAWGTEGTTMSFMPTYLNTWNFAGIFSSYINKTGYTKIALTADESEGNYDFGWASYEYLSGASKPYITVNYTVDTPPAPAVPAAPTAGTPSNVTTNSIRWNFTDNANNETGFKLHDSVHALRASSANPNLSYINETGLNPNTQHIRHVHAYNAVGESAASANMTKYTLSNPPTNAAASDATFIDKISISWTASASANRYRVYRDGVSGNGTLVYNNTGTSFDDAITGNHTYYIYSVNNDNVENPSSISDSGSTFVDTTAPTVTSVNSIAPDATYKTGDVVSIQVNFSEPVLVFGIPQLTLETGETDRVVNYVTGSGTPSLTFDYIVQSGDASSDLDYSNSFALTLNSATIKDGALNNAILTLPAPGAANSLGANKGLVIDTATPPDPAGDTFTWTTQNDFENNLSNFQTPTTRNNVTTTKNPGDVQLTDKSTTMEISNKNVDDYYIGHTPISFIEPLNDGWVVGYYNKVLFVNRDGSTNTSITLPFGTPNSHIGFPSGIYTWPTSLDGAISKIDNRLYVAATTGLAYVIDLNTKTLLADQINLNTDGGYYTTMRMFVNKTGTKLVLGSTDVLSRGYLNEPAVYVSQIDIATGNLDNRIMLGSAHFFDENAYVYDADNNIFWSSSIYTYSKYGRITENHSALRPIYRVDLNNFTVKENRQDNYSIFMAKTLQIDSQLNRLYVLDAIAGPGTSIIDIYDTSNSSDPFRKISRVIVEGVIPYSERVAHGLEYDQQSKTFAVQVPHTNSSIRPYEGGAIKFKVNDNGTYEVVENNTNVTRPATMIRMNPTTGALAIPEIPKTGITFVDHTETGENRLVAGPFSTSGYNTPGSIVLTAKSPADDVVKWKNVLFGQTLLDGDTMKFRTRSADSQSGLSSATWSSWYNTADYSGAYPADSSSIFTNGVYVQLEVSLTSPGDNTPVLHSVNIDYEKINTDPVPPTAPVLTTTALGLDINLTWTPSIDEANGINHYIIERSIDGLTFTPIATTSDITYTDANLDETTYYYRVKAVSNSSLESEYSNIDQETLNVPPIANAGEDQQVNEGATVSYTGSAIDVPSDILTYSWDFGDGSEPELGASATHTYLDNGTYTATLTVTDKDGAISTDSLVVTVNNLPPVVDAGPDQEIDEGQTVSVTGSATDVAADQDTLTYSWDFGDGSDPELGASATHTYLDNGVYTATLTVTDKDGGVGTDTLVVTVNKVNEPPVVDAGPDQVVDEGQSVNFSGSATDDNDTADSLTYSWDFGDGTTGEGQTPTHTYIDNGTYTVTLTVTDSEGLSSSDTLVVTVENVAPSVDAGGDQEIDEGQSVDLHGTATDPGVNDTLTYSWDFGDGSEDATSADASHTYKDNGIYTVTLTVTDKDGGVGTDTLVVTVNNLPPVVDAGNDVTVLWGENISFSGTHSDPGDDTFTYQWNFGDGNVTSDEKPQHTFAEPGTYTVTYTVTDDDGGVGSDTLIVTVKPRPSSSGVDPSVTQYSDPASLIATLLTDTGTPIQDESVNFKVDGSDKGSDSTDENGKAGVDPLIYLAQGNYLLEAIFGGNNLYEGSNAQNNLSVNRELASLTYNGDVLADSNSSVNLSSIVNQDADGNLGDIKLASPVKFELYNNAGLYDTFTAQSTADVEGQPGVGVASTQASNLPADVYKVIVRLGANDYYEAPIAESVLVVYNPQGGFVTGGGWITNSGQKANFGFNAKYKNDGTLQGEFTMLDRVSGKPVQIKATSLEWLVVRSDMKSASFAGKAQVDGQGSYDFRVDIVDNGEPGKSDTFKVSVSNGYSAEGTLDGGNIQVHK